MCSLSLPLKPNLPQEKFSFPLVCASLQGAEGTEGIQPSGDVFETKLAPEEFLTAPGRAVGCSKAGKSKD